MAVKGMPQHIGGEVLRLIHPEGSCQREQGILAPVKCAV